MNLPGNFISQTTAFCRLANKCFVRHSHFLALLFAVLLSSCGYTLQGGGTVLPDDVKKIYVNFVENNTTEPALGVRLTQELKARFSRYGVVEIVDSAQEADATLDTAITSVTSSASSVTGRTSLELQNLLVMTISSRLAKKDGSILWRNENLQITRPFANVSDAVVASSSEFATSGISSSDLTTLGNRELVRSQQAQAQQYLIQEAAKTIYLSSVAESF